MLLFWLCNCLIVFVGILNEQNQVVTPFFSLPAAILEPDDI